MCEDLCVSVSELLFTDEAKEVLDYLVNDRKYDPEVIRNSEFCYFPAVSKIRVYLHKEHLDKTSDINDLPLFGPTGDKFRLAIP